MIELSLGICLLDEELQQVYDEIPQERSFLCCHEYYRLAESIQGVNTEDSICRLGNAIFAAKLVCCNISAAADIHISAGVTPTLKTQELLSQKYPSFLSDFSLSRVSSG